VVALDTNRFRGRFTDGLSTTGRDPFFPTSERGRPGTASANIAGLPSSTPSAPTNWLLTAIVIDTRRREAKINGVWLSQGASKRLSYPGGTALVECVEVAPAWVILRVDGKLVEKKIGRGANP